MPVWPELERSEAPHEGDGALRATASDRGFEAEAIAVGDEPANRLARLV